MARIPEVCPACKSAEWVCIHEFERSTGLTNNFDRRGFMPVIPVGVNVKRMAVYSCRKCGYSQTYDRK